MADSLVKQDDEKEATCALWRRCREMLDQDYPEAAFISEWSFPQRALTKAGFHMDFYLDWTTNGYHALFRKTGADGSQLSFFSKQGKGNIMDFLDDYLPKYRDTHKDGFVSFITCNHDTPRMTKAFDALECKIAYCFLMTMPGVPFLYYGDEIGMQYLSLTSKEGGYQRTGTRTPMQWSDGTNKGFSSAPAKKLYLPVDPSPDAPSVASQENDPDSILNTLRRVIALRHKMPDLQAEGEFEVLYARANEYPFVYRRGELLLAVNPSAKPVSNLTGLTMPEKGKVSNGSALFSIGEASLQNGALSMNGQSFAIFRLS
jgi:maltose alpha-D-glucosyltransferase/alpha-amylase